MTAALSIIMTAARRGMMRKDWAAFQRQARLVVAQTTAALTLMSQLTLNNGHLLLQGFSSPGLADTVLPWHDFIITCQQDLQLLVQRQTPSVLQQKIWEQEQKTSEALKTISVSKQDLRLPEKQSHLELKKTAESQPRELKLHTQQLFIPLVNMTKKTVKINLHLRFDLVFKKDTKSNLLLENKNFKKFFSYTQCSLLIKWILFAIFFFAKITALVFITIDLWIDIVLFTYLIFVI